MKRVITALHHLRTKVKTPGQNGSRERGLGTSKYDSLFIDDIDDAIMLAKHAEEYRLEDNQVRPPETITWNRALDAHLGTTDPTLHTKQTLPTT